MKKVDRRKRIRSHIKRKGEQCDFEITESFALYWWHQLNETIFDGVLTPPVRFEIKNFRDCGGWCIPYLKNRTGPRRVRIGLLRDYWDRKTFLIVLAHEMVHQWEWEIQADWNPNVEHGTDFFSWQNKVKYRIGLPLDRHVDL